MIERHPDVTACDLPEIYAFIARNDPVAADRVLDAVEDTFRQIAQYPECGAIYPSRSAKLKGLRILPVSRYHNYLVFYRIDGDTVRVLHVVHGGRHLVRLFKRESRG
jgi:toxin ParE1/3/4